MFINFLRTDKRSISLLLLRLYIGFIWLSSGIAKVAGKSFNASGFLKGTIAQASRDYPKGDFLQHFVLTDADLQSLSHFF